MADSHAHPSQTTEERFCENVSEWRLWKHKSLNEI